MIGSHTFIDNFEEQLIGHNIGEDMEVNVTFPENYQMEDYAGKEATFKCKLNGITETQLPEADDDLMIILSTRDDFTYPDPAVFRRGGASAGGEGELRL